MPKRKLCLSGAALALVIVVTACQPPSPTPTATGIPPSPTNTAPLPNDPTSTAALPAATATATAPPTPMLVPSPTAPPTWPARWEPTGGPEGGFIETVVVNPTDPNTVYAAGLGGVVFRSNDAGQTWAPSERLAPASCPFASLIVDVKDSSTIYAAHACAGVLKSADAGMTWENSSSGLSGGVAVLVQSSYAPDLLLAADPGGQVFRSRDAANTWELVSNGLAGEPIRSLGASDLETYWATTANSHTGALYRYSSGIWAAVPFDQPAETEAISLLTDPADPATVYVGLVDVVGAHRNPDKAYLFRSTDGGASWSPLNALGAAFEADSNDTVPTRGVYLVSKGQRSGTLFIVSSAGLLSSDDGGVTWSQIKLPQEALPAEELRQIVLDPTNNDVLYLPLGSIGIGKSLDGGRTWETVTRGFNNLPVSIVATHPSERGTVYIGTARGLTFYRSDDYGSNWVRLGHSGLDHVRPGNIVELIADPNGSDTLFQALDGGSILRSEDKGTTWTTVWPESGFSSIRALAVSPSSPTTVYASRNGFGLFRSDDGGQSWRLLSSAPLLYAGVLAVHPVEAGFLLSGEIRQPIETSAQLYLSRDGGDSWKSALEVNDAVGIASAAFDPRVQPFFAPGTQPADSTRLYAASVGPRGAIWSSNDAGESWRALNDDLNFANVSLLTVAPRRPGVAYAGVWGAGTWRTDDGGQSWHRVPGDPATSAAAIVVDPNNSNTVYIADETTPHLYRSTDDGNTWELLFDAGNDFGRLGALALAPSDPSVLYISAMRAAIEAADGILFRVDVDASDAERIKDVTNDLPGAPSSLAVRNHDPQRVFAVVPGQGLWKTVDGGATWRPVKSGLPEIDLHHIAVHPTLPETLFLIAGDDLPSGLGLDESSGIWKSSDDGNSWVRVGGTTFRRSSSPVQALAFHPEDERVMYAAAEGGIYLSPDRGETWTSITGRLPFTAMRAVATDGKTLYAGSATAGVFVGAVHPLIHTADWVAGSHLSVPISHIQIALHPSDPQTLYVSAYPGGVFKTADGGSVWRSSSSGLPSFGVADASRQGYYALVIAPSSPDVLYVGMYGQGVFRSDDGAVSWRPIFGDDERLKAATVQAMLVHPDDPNIVYAATEQGVWRTVNGGESWGDFGTGLPSSGDVRTLALSPDGQLFAGTGGYGAYTRNAFHQGSDDGWRQLPALTDSVRSWALPSDRLLSPRTTLLIPPGDSNTLYAGSPVAGVYKSPDGGLTWRERNVGLGNVGVLSFAIHPRDSQILYAGTTDGIFRSTDGGVTWHRAGVGWPPQQRIGSIAFDPEEPAVLYACSRGGESGGQGREGLHGMVMKSTDGGATWFEITTGLDLNQVFVGIVVDPAHPSILYVATEHDGIYITRDGGANWTTWNEGLWNRVAGSAIGIGQSILQLSADGRLLYFGTAGSGLWRRPAEGAP